jgi:hypothetical protein
MSSAQRNLLLIFLLPALIAGLSRSVLGDDQQSANSQTDNAGNFKGHVSTSRFSDLGTGNDNIISPTTSQNQALNGSGYTGLQIIDGKVDVIIDFSPAYGRKDIRRGDQVLAVDGVDIASLSNSYVKALLRGTPGTVATITISKYGQKQDVKIVRAELPLTVPDGLTSSQYYELGLQIRDATGNNALARIALHKAIELDPGGNTGDLARKVLSARIPRYEPSDKALDLLRQAYILSKDHQYDQAETLFLACIRRWPEFEWPYKDLSSQYIVEKKYAKAEEVCRSLLKVNPNYARGWYVLGYARYCLGDRAEADECRKKARELDPADQFGP